MGYIFATVVIGTYLLCSPPVHSAITEDTGVCGSTKGCYSIPDGCDPDVAGSCRAFSSWSLRADKTSLLINLWSNTTTYIAMGFSKSGGMTDSDVYACISGGMKVVRSRNAETGRSNEPQPLVGVTDPKVLFANGTLSCSFVRVLEDNSGGDTFFDLTSPNKYTPILAWGGQVVDDRLMQHSNVDRGSHGTEIDFDGSGSDPSQKSHTTLTVLMLLCTFVSAAFFQ